MYSFSQGKKDIIFIFNEKNVNTYIQKDSIYLLDGLTFRFDSKKHKRTRIAYDSIKEKIITIKDFKQKTSNSLNFTIIIIFIFF